MRVPAVLLRLIGRHGPTTLRLALGCPSISLTLACRRRRQEMFMIGCPMNMKPSEVP